MGFYLQILSNGIFLTSYTEVRKITEVLNICKNRAFLV